MAAFIRRFSREETILYNLRSPFINKYGNLAKWHVKAFGLLSCSHPILHDTESASAISPDCSFLNRPQLSASTKAACPRPPGFTTGDGVLGFSFKFLSSPTSFSPRYAAPNHAGTSSYRKATETNIVKRTDQLFTAADERESLKMRLSEECQTKSQCNNLTGNSQMNRGKVMHNSKESVHPSHFTNKNFLRQTKRNMLQQVRHFASNSRKSTSHKKEKSYYDVLGVTPHATQAQVKGAYFKLSKIYHPDKNAGSKAAQTQFASINEAYSILGNLTLRKRYDRGTLSQRDVYGEVSEEEKEREEDARAGPMYTGSGLPFDMEAKRQAKNFDDFLSKHYKAALDKEQRDRAERQERIDEYMELQKKAKLSPIVLAAFMLMAVILATKSVASNAVNKKLREPNKDNQ